MTGGKARWAGFGLIAGAGAGLLSLTSIMNSAFAYGDTPVDGGSGFPFEVMGGSGLPLPDHTLVDYYQTTYFPSAALFSGQPTYPGADPQALYTPEGFYPITGVKDLPLNTSVSRASPS